jgi:hypothetical protein
MRRPKMTHKLTVKELKEHDTIENRIALPYAVENEKLKETNVNYLSIIGVLEDRLGEAGISSEITPPKESKPREWNGLKIMPVSDGGTVLLKKEGK